MQEIISNISTSVQKLEDTYICLTDHDKYCLADIYDDKVSNMATIPCQVFNIP
jgi:hypothetical protein